MTHPQPSYSISLCICTMNRPDDLDRCLASVLQSSEPPDEIIVSDDSPHPEPTQAVVAKYAKVIYQSGPRRGLSPNRNACIQRASSSHLIFIDDDVCVSPDFFAVARRLIAENPTRLITGYEMNHGGGGRWEGEVRKVVPHNADFWGLQRLPVTQDYRAVVINSTIFPRPLFEQALFDEHLRYGSEEIDMAQHAHALGYEIIYADDLYVNHYPSPINREQYKRFVHASRLYTTTKAYLHYDRSILKLLAFVILAPLQLIGSTVKRKGIAAVGEALEAIAIATRYFFTKPKSVKLDNS